LAAYDWGYYCLFHNDDLTSAANFSRAGATVDVKICGSKTMPRPLPPVWSADVGQGGLAATEARDLGKVWRIYVVTVTSWSRTYGLFLEWRGRHGAELY